MPAIKRRLRTYSPQTTQLQSILVCTRGGAMKWLALKLNLNLAWLSQLSYMRARLVLLGGPLEGRRQLP